MHTGKGRIAADNVVNDEQREVNTESIETETIRAEMDEIIYELTQCREDDRAGKTLIFQILTVTVTFLTVAMTLYYNEVLPVPVVLLEALITFLLCAMFPFIVNIGMLSTFRHHYVVERERRLSELHSQLQPEDEFYHWEEACTPFITVNLKKISIGRLGLYGLNFYIAFGSILMLTLIYIAAIYYMAHANGSGWGVLETVLFALFGVVFILTVVCFNMDSRKNYETAKVLTRQRREEMKTDSEKLTRKDILHYFLYPRIKDCQKASFLVVGFALGIIMHLAADESYVFFFLDELPVILFAGFIIDGLVYQARYLWNDLRGLPEDSQHVMKEKRGRFLAELPRDKAVKYTAMVITARLLLAILCISIFGGAQMEVLVICSGLIALNTVLYEWARTKEMPRMTLFLVCFGYPIRLLAGFWCAWPDMFAAYVNAPIYGMIFFCILLGTAFFGELFVSMTWAMEAVAYDNTPKIHLLYLKKHYFGAEMDSEIPLWKNEKKYTLWNACAVFMTILLMLAIWLLWTSGTLQNENSFEQYILLVALLLVLIGYLAIYWMFLHSNYEGLYTFWDELKDNLNTVCTRLKYQILIWFAGEETSYIIIKEKYNTWKNINK